LPPTSRSYRDRVIVGGRILPATFGVVARMRQHPLAHLDTDADLRGAIQPNIDTGARVTLAPP